MTAPFMVRQCGLCGEPHTLRPLGLGGIMVCATCYHDVHGRPKPTVPNWLLRLLGRGEPA